MTLEEKESHIGTGLQQGPIFSSASSLVGKPAAVVPHPADPLSRAGSSGRLQDAPTHPVHLDLTDSKRRGRESSETLRLSIVIPALNERENIKTVIESVPTRELEDMGYSLEVLVVDNGSIDGTGAIARDCGAVVVNQPVRGYGSAYKAGFANCWGDVIATADADQTYPLEDIPRILRMMEANDWDFVSTNRLEDLDPEAMHPSHIWGNKVLSHLSKMLFAAPFRDSQSGMWIFNRRVWAGVEVRSNGMAFSQELKHEAYLRGFRCAEVDIRYRPRGGAKKLRTFRDGAMNTSQLFTHRVRTLVGDSVGIGAARPTGVVAVPIHNASDSVLDIEAAVPVGATTIV